MRHLGLDVTYFISVLGRCFEIEESYIPWLLWKQTTPRVAGHLDGLHVGTQDPPVCCSIVQHLHDMRLYFRKLGHFQFLGPGNMR